MSNRNSDYYQKQFDEAYRPGVGALLVNADNKVLVCERIDSRNSWQLPQGGIDDGEDPREAVFRELEEEVGVGADKAEIIAETKEWLYYDFPPHVVEKFGNQYRGQRHKWFALRFKGSDEDFDLNTFEEPEFSAWKWVELDKVAESVVHFKRESYRQIIAEFKELLS